MKTNQDNPKEKNIGTQLNIRVNQWQRQAAAFLSQKTRNWTSVQLKAALLIFCLTMGCASLYIAGTALRNDHGPPLIRANTIQIPRVKRPGGKVNNQDSITIKSNSK